MLDDALGEMYGIKRKDGEGTEVYRERLRRFLTSPPRGSAHELAFALYAADCDVAFVGYRELQHRIEYTLRQRLRHLAARVMFYFTRGARWLPPPTHTPLAAEFAVVVRRGCAVEEKDLRAAIEDVRPAGVLIQFAMYQEVGGVP